MTGGNDDAAPDTKVRRREVNFFRAAQANILYRDTLLEEPFDERALDRLTGQADVMAHHDRARLNDLGVGFTDATGDVLVKLVWDPSPNVVGLETVEHVCHSGWP